MTKEPTKNNIPSNDEVDLIQLLNMLGNGISKLFQNLYGFIISILIYLHNMITKYAKIWLIVTVVSIIVIIIFQYKFQQESMTIRATFKSEYLKGINFVNHVRNLNQLILLGEYESLTAKLKLPPEVVEDFQEIKVGSINSGVFEEIRNNDSYTDSDSLSTNLFFNATSFYISIKLSKDISGLSSPDIQKSIVNYISSNTYLQREYENSLINLKNKIKFFQTELTKMENLDQTSMDVIEKSLNTGSLTGDYVSIIDANGNYIVRSDLLSQSLRVKQKYRELVEELYDLESELRTAVTLQIISNFERIKVKEFPWLKEIKIALLVYGVVFGSILLIDFNNYINRSKEKRLSKI